MKRGALVELEGPEGFRDVAAVVNCANRLSFELMGDRNPGLVSSAPNGTNLPGAPYSKPKDGKVCLRCALWVTAADEEERCEVKKSRDGSWCLSYDA